jgi:type III secretion system (T3SS) chaperone YscW
VTLLVEGWVTGPPLPGAFVHVVLEEASRADAPATIIAKTVIEYGPGRVPFALRGAAPTDPDGTYLVRAWVDQELYSVESRPVTLGGDPSPVTITVERENNDGAQP